MNILDKIIAQKKLEIAAAKKITPMKELEMRLTTPPRGFIRAIETKLATHKPAVIAEIKKASPSQGVIRENFDLAAIAKSYAAASAACLSVLTDEQFFQGSANYLQEARSACNLPILRKDFIIDPYQVFETKAMNADCLLLIVAALDQHQLITLHELAREVNLDVLLEVHDHAELERALQLDNKLIGINNRNLKTFTTSLNTTIDLLKFIPENRIVVTESGIHTAADVKFMREHHVHCFLVGESMMRAENPGEKLKALFLPTAADHQ